MAMRQKLSAAKAGDEKEIISTWSLEGQCRNKLKGLELQLRPYARLLCERQEDLLLLQNKAKDLTIDLAVLQAEVDTQDITRADYANKLATYKEYTDGAKALLGEKSKEYISASKHLADLSLTTATFLNDIYNPAERALLKIKDEYRNCLDDISAVEKIVNGYQRMVDGLMIEINKLKKFLEEAAMPAKSRRTSLLAASARFSFSKQSLSASSDSDSDPDLAPPSPLTPRQKK